MPPHGLSTYRASRFVPEPQLNKRKHIMIAHLIRCSFLFSIVTAAAYSSDLTPAQKLIASPGLLVIAHRGNSSVAPENTLPAFQAALDVKVDLVELDYHHSADGVPIVVHDDTLDRTTNSEGVFHGQKLKVQDFRAAELQPLDAGFWFDARFAGTKLPTLTQALDLIQSKSVTLIERKAGDPQTLVRVLEEKQLLERVVVQAFDLNFVAECRKLSPRLALATLHGKPATVELIQQCAATGADVIVWDHQKIEPQQIELIHKLGKKAWIYTVDKPEAAKKFIAAGIDGIITNKPAEMLKLR
jgi:glycerophosphoryl diester phosphodiesterase